MYVYTYKVREFNDNRASNVPKSDMVHVQQIILKTLLIHTKVVVSQSRIL